MLTNQEMVAGRYLRWHKANRMVNFIVTNLLAGRRIQINTMTRATIYKPCHAGMFKATRTGAYVRSGKRWICIDYTAIQAF